MSLVDSMATELPVREAGKEVFFAIRIDNARGSGTRDDPYNGSTDAGKRGQT